MGERAEGGGGGAWRWITRSGGHRSRQYPPRTMAVGGLVRRPTGPWTCPTMGQGFRETSTTRPLPLLTVTSLTHPPLPSTHSPFAASYLRVPLLCDLSCVCGGGVQLGDHRVESLLVSYDWEVLAVLYSVQINSKHFIHSTWGNYIASRRARDKKQNNKNNNNRKKPHPRMDNKLKQGHKQAVVFF